MRLNGRTALVAGVGSNIGRACALRFAKEGAQVLAVDPNEALAKAVTAEIKAAGGEASYCAADIASEVGAKVVATRSENLWQRLDVLMHCGAAIDFWSSDDDNNLENWEHVNRTNLLGPVFYTKQLLPLLKRSQAGSIVYLSSVDGIKGNPDYPAYSASKGALIPLTHVNAFSYAPFGIRVNCLATAAISQSGPEAKPRFPLSTEALQTSIMKVTPLRRHAKPEDIASVALFFASDDSAYVTGTVLPVDGGRLAITPGTLKSGSPRRD